MPKHPLVEHPIFLELEKKRKEVDRMADTVVPVAIIIPFLGFLLAMVMTDSKLAVLVITGVFALFSLVYYSESVKTNFIQVYKELKAAMVKEFMAAYHPEVAYQYFPDQQDAINIINRSSLFPTTYLEEEDVIAGRQDGMAFYFSEISIGGSEKLPGAPYFKGYLFHLKIPGQNFPKSSIKSKTDGLDKLLSGFQKHHIYKFFYQTNDKPQFDQSLKKFFPFFRHLIEKGEKIFMHTEKEELTVLVSSDMKLLDDPKPTLHQTFLNPEYFENFGKQLNTLLYLVESFSNNLDTTQIEERLELKALAFMSNKKASSKDQEIP